jgi:hypothetical protein
LEQRRTVYRCCYYYHKNDLFSPVRDSRPFKTEKGVRAEAEDLKARGYRVSVWRYHEVKVGRRWRVDLDSELTQCLDKQVADSA